MYLTLFFPDACPLEQPGPAGLLSHLHCGTTWDPDSQGHPGTPQPLSALL